MSSDAAKDELLKVMTPEATTKKHDEQGEGEQGEGEQGEGEQGEGEQGEQERRKKGLERFGKFMKAVAAITEASKGNTDPLSKEDEDLENTIVPTGLDISDSLVTRLNAAGVPDFYWPTSIRIWIELVNRMEGAEANSLRPPKPSGFEQQADQAVDDFRNENLKKFAGSSTETPGIKFQGLIGELKDKLLASTVTMNIALDKLFRWTSPHLLNAFEVKSLSDGEVTQNIKGDLEGERVDAEKKNFNISKDAAARMRPRYAALNFKDNRFGAAPRNDYGLSHMVFKDSIKNQCTVTAGDSFNTGESPVRLTEQGIDHLLKEMNKTSGGKMEDFFEGIFNSEYKPNDSYFEVQIHQDIDLRQDVEKIVISKAEMALFKVDDGTLKALMDQVAPGVAFDVA